MSAPRFVFAVPFKPRSACSDWELAQANLRLSVRSARAAAVGTPARIVVACHDLPDLGSDAGEDVELLRVPFPAPADAWGGGADKARKRRFVGAWLRSRLTEPQVHVMFLDADDLVHRDLVRHVLASEGASHVVDHGYVLDLSAGLLQHLWRDFHRRCGSSFVCRFGREELPLAADDLEAVFSQFGAAPEQRGHPEYADLASELGRAPRPFPFPAVVYTTNHPESLWAAKWQVRRRVGRARDLVSPSQARRILAEEFAAPELARALSGAGGVTRAVALVTGERLRARLAGLGAHARSRAT